jgi:hypothetical protein
MSAVALVVHGVAVAVHRVDAEHVVHEPIAIVIEVVAALVHWKATARAVGSGTFLRGGPGFPRIAPHVGGEIRVVVIHAGMRPGVPVEQQHKTHLLRMRYIQFSDNEMWSSIKAPPPEIATKWTNLWTGPEDVIYGHQPSQGDVVYTQNNGVRCWGIDTGACFGNRLTAMLITDRIEFVSVPARAKYAEWFTDRDDNG